MTEQPSAENLPSDEHLQEDISAVSGEAKKAEHHFNPSLTNAGQQVAGLASPTNYGEESDPDSADDSNNPI
ncbi:hypothetical protein [Arthrobacter sp. ISL-30]|uniref:hypothetical protein n=1 Tax=Arthrobacter sp. ISL-30 TaxID=2819109 RepID=UPI001BEB1E01|nr:hypothetical protein [Arthrobacter sp. ISL-30]MBT2514647.1 hypothetical protein [Arthrobacter sp. ISL-30]